jgi:UDP-glucose 4-epimerase
VRVLLTGSSGWLGRFLAPALRSAGHTVIGLDVVPGADTTFVGSVALKANVERVFADYAIEAVIHAGGLHKPDIKRFPAQAFVDVNVTGTLNLLDAAVAAGHDRFVFTSTTSLMISQDIRDEAQAGAIWLDEDYAPLAPRNIYGVTKLAAEHLCRLRHLIHGLNCIVLRTARFFPEDDDTLLELGGENLKANEFLNRRLTVEDAARAHITALERAPLVKFGVFVVCAPTPFSRDDAMALKLNALPVIGRVFPDAVELYAQRGWQLPASIARVYDSTRARVQLGFECRTSFGSILEALRNGTDLPIIHDPAFTSPIERAQA